MNSNKYWKKRAEEREEEWSKKSKKEIEKEIKNLYIRALINIKKDINDLYERFADENGLSMADAKKLITGNEFTVWRMDIEDYVWKSELDNNLLKELNTLAMKSRISRLDKLYGEISLELVKMAEGYDNQLSEYLRTSLVDNYYHTTFDICKGLNLLLPVSTLDPEAIEDIIKTPWSGKQFSKRIWNNTETLSKILKQEISSAMIRGVNAREMAQVISKKMDSSYKQAVTLVRSELNYVNNQSSLKSIKDAGGEKYRFIATLDSRTSMICRQLDGTIHEVDKGVPGTNMPPMHPRCRSTIAISNLTTSTARKRISRVNGEIKYVPANMKYSDWENIYVKKTMSLNDWEKKNNNGKINIRNKDTALAKAIGNEHHEKAYDILNKSTEINASNVWKKLENKIRIMDVNNGGRRAYASYGGINLDISYVSKGDDISKPYQTLFHEGSHFIDMYVGRILNSKLGYISTGYEDCKFINTIKQEIKEFIENKNKALKKEFKSRLESNDIIWFRNNGFLSNMQISIPNGFKYRKAFVYRYIQKELREIPLINRGNISDIFEGATKGKVSAGVGHGGATYWKKRTFDGIERGLGSEAFAEFMDASIANLDSLNIMKKYLPNSHKVFSEILDFILKEVDKYEK